MLTGDEASAVLRELLSVHPQLIPDAREAANALLAAVSFTDVATRIFEALLALDLDDLDAGPHAGGYIEPFQKQPGRRSKMSLPRTSTTSSGG